MDFENLAHILLGNWRTLLPEWLPGGKIRGHEYVCGSIRGGVGESFSVNTQTGKWADFSEGSKGGDLTSLYAAMNGISQIESAKRLSLDFAPAPVKDKRPSVKTIVAPPPEAPIPSMVHLTYGEPVSWWVYRNWKREPIFYVARYQDGDKKQIVPWSWCMELGKFIAKSYNEPRPLYGLDLLSENPDKPVLMVEGEKSADAARLFAGNTYCVMSWPNGSQSIDKCNWKVLENRKILLWPDADEPGVKAMTRIAEKLFEKSPEIKIIDVSDHQDGWDAADSGFTWETFVEWAKPRIKIIEKPAPELLKPESKKPLDISLEVTEPQEKNISDSMYAIWDKIGIVKSSNGSPIMNVDNVLRVLEESEPFRGLVWYDEFHNKIFTTYGGRGTREWEPIDDLNLAAFLQRDLKLSKISDDLVNKAIQVHAHRHKKNEPKDWMDGLKWDGVARIEYFFTELFGGEDNNYVRTASKNWWISMAARIYSPGIKVDTMVILEGAQGKFKSTALSIIGGKWYAEAHESVTSKDFFMLLQGKLLLEISEFDSFQRAEVNTIKKVVSCQSDRFRPPYGRTTQDFPRQCVFVATTNEEDYLRDYTGARRFWPIKIGDIKLNEIRIARDQLFAEAVHRLHQGETWYHMPGAARDEQEDRRQHDEWEPLISEYLAAEPHRLDGFLLRDIARKVLGIYEKDLTRPIQNRIARIMRFFGYKSKQVRVGPQNTNQRGWVKID